MILAFPARSILDSTVAGRSLLTAADASAQRSLLGLGTLATQNGNIADYLTIASAISSYQPLDSDLTAIAALSTTPFGRSLLVQADAAAVRSYIGAGTSSFDGTFASLTGKPTTLSGYGITDAQPLDSDLTAIAALTTTAFGRGLLTETDASSTRSTLGLGTLATQSANISDYLTISGAAAAYQPLDSDLTAIAALSTAAYGRSLLTQADAPAARTTLGLGSGNSPTFNGLTVSGSVSIGTATLVRNSADDFRISSGDGFQRVRAYSLWSDMLGAGIGDSGVAGGAAVHLAANAALGWTSGGNINTGTYDLFVRRDAANIFAQRNGVNAQTLRVYNTFTDGSNHERGKFAWETNVLRIGTERAGTGLARSLELQTDGVSRVAITTSFVFLQNSFGFGWSGRAYFASDATNTIRMMDNAGTGFGLLQFGGTSNAFPALRRDGAALSIRLADDSGNADLTARSISLSGDTSQVAINYPSGQAIRIVGAISTSSMFVDVPRVFFRDNSNSNANSLSIVNSNVGIGTNNPTGRLDVADTTLAGSGSLAGSLLNLSQTWNTTGTPTAILLNVTNTASNAASLLMDLRADGSSIFRVWRAGVSTGSFVAVYSGGQGACLTATAAARFLTVGYLNGNLVQFGSTTSIGWTAGPDSYAVLDTILVRDAANTIAQRNGVNAQTLRVYNTFTDGSNHERGKFAWETNILRIGTERAGTGSARALEFQTDGATRLTVSAAGVTTISNLIVANANIFWAGSVTVAGSATQYIVDVGTQAFTGASGSTSAYSTRTAFNPASGTMQFTGMNIAPSINQTGGANGITRGIHINPTLTAAADWRAIEIAAGITILAATTTTSASLRIPSGTAPSSPADGDIWRDSLGYRARLAGVSNSFVLSPATGTDSIAVGVRCNTSANNTGEYGIWSSTTSRGGSYRVSQNGMVSQTLVNSASTPSDGGVVDGAETNGTLPRNMISFRRNGLKLFVDFNDAGTIRTLEIGDLA